MCRESGTRAGEGSSGETRVTKNNDLYAVITGDIVRSSRLGADQRRRLLSRLKSSFKAVERIFPGTVCAPFEMHRGDSFQGVLSKPEAALRTALIIRASVRYGVERGRGQSALDARLALGIGTIDVLPRGRVREGDGVAFRRSGLTLDTMKGDRRLLIRTPWPEVDAELHTECALLDALVRRWTTGQAQAMLGQLRGLSQADAAREFGISQPSVQERLKGANAWAIEELCRRYERLISESTGVNLS